jgi:nucleoside-diphosphate-sugar epimerase
VTGATGFIGAHLIKELIKDSNNTILALVRRKNSCWRLQKYLGSENLHLLEVDFLDYFSLVYTLQGYNPQVLFYLLWEGVQNVYRDDPIQIKNRQFLTNLLRLAKELGIKTIVGLGSQAEYGIKDRPIREEESLHPITLYGMEKIWAYHMVKDYCEIHDIKYLWLRLFSSYGPMDHPTWLIPYVITHLLQNKEIRLTEGWQKWDYLYVEDVAKALVAVISIKEGGVFNLGTGESIVVRDIVHTMYHELKRKVKPPFGTLPYRKNQQMLVESDMTKFFSMSHWRPSISLREGLSRTIDYYRHFLNFIT